MCLSTGPDPASIKTSHALEKYALDWMLFGSFRILVMYPDGVNDQTCVNAFDSSMDFGDS